jgi:integrase
MALAMGPRYRDSSSWAALSAATRRQRENLMRPTLEDAGDMPIVGLTRARIVDGRERRAKTPSQANNWLNMMHGLCQWAKDAEHIGHDPTEGVKTVTRPKTGGFREASEEAIAAFRAHWAPGKRERLALEIFPNTGLRRGDAARFGRQHIRDDMITPHDGEDRHHRQDSHP